MFRDSNTLFNQVHEKRALEIWHSLMITTHKLNSFAVLRLLESSRDTNTLLYNFPDEKLGQTLILTLLHSVLSVYFEGQTILIVISVYKVKSHTI